MHMSPSKARSAGLEGKIPQVATKQLPEVFYPTSGSLNLYIAKKKAPATGLCDLHLGSGRVAWVAVRKSVARGRFNVP